MLPVLLLVAVRSGSILTRSVRSFVGRFVRSFVLRAVLLALILAVAILAIAVLAVAVLAVAVLIAVFIAVSAIRAVVLHICVFCHVFLHPDTLLGRHSNLICLLQTYYLKKGQKIYKGKFLNEKNYKS